MTNEPDMDRKLQTFLYISIGSSSESYCKINQVDPLTKSLSIAWYEQIEELTYH